MNSDKALKERLEDIKEKENISLADYNSKSAKEKNFTKQSWMLTALVCVFTGLCVFLATKGVPVPVVLLADIAVIIAVNFVELKKGNRLLANTREEAREHIDGVHADLNEVIEIARDASSTKRNFLTHMSHELRTPLSAMLGLDEMIQRESREEHIRGYASSIKSAGNTLLTLINDVIDTSKIETGRLEIIPMRYDLGSFINDISNMTLTRANDKGLKFKIKVDEKTPHLLRGDEVRVKQCVLNIVSNAIKFTEEGSVILEIGFAKLTDTSILLSISVTDTGRGMRQEDMDRLFVPFEKIEAEKNKDIPGIGLGMNITKNLLKLMDSELRVDSKYGVGSSFKFSVKQEVMDWQPIGNIEEAYTRLREPDGRYKESFQAPDARVLVVDDSSVNLTIVEGLLKKTKMQLTLVESGEEAVRLSKEQEFDLLLIDHMMPGMDGVETLKEIKKDSKNKDKPIVALTANAVSGAKDYYVGEGFTDYLAKPIEPEKLEAAIRNYLDPKLLSSDFEEEEISEDLKPEDKKGKTSFMDKIKDIENIDVNKGLEYSGTPDLYEKVVTEFADTASSRADTIETYFEQEDYRNYTIQVHALKSAARLIGAIKVSQLAMALEAAGNEENAEKIKNATPELLRLYRKLSEDLGAILTVDEDLPEIDEDSLKDAYLSIKEMAENFDFDSIDSVMEELKKYKIPDSKKEEYLKLKTLVAEVARDDIIDLLGNIK